MSPVAKIVFFSLPFLSLIVTFAVASNLLISFAKLVGVVPKEILVKYSLLYFTGNLSIIYGIYVLISFCYYWL